MNATSLRQLLEIRRAHATRLRKFKGYLGSAVGYKWSESNGDFELDDQGERKPAVLVFVQRKLAVADLSKAQLIPATLEGPDDLTCVTDVVEGALPSAAPATPPLSADAAAVKAALHTSALPFVGGLPISSALATGTAACVVRSTAAGATKGQLGLLTNWHVSGLVGNQLVQPQPRLRSAGTTQRIVFAAPRTRKDLNDLESFTDAEHRIDCGYIALPTAAKVAPGVHALPPLGAPLSVDLDTLAIIGQRVVGVGQARGRQRGRVAAFGYEWVPEPGARPQITDFLILGDDNQPFATAGDSGKLVVTDDAANRPLALLWGGQKQGFWNTQAQESWAYASAIDVVLRALRIELLTTAPRPTAGRT